MLARVHKHRHYFTFEPSAFISDELIDTLVPWRLFAIVAAPASAGFLLGVLFAVFFANVRF